MWRRSKRKPTIGRPPPQPLDKLITVGICAMDKKTGSKAMKEILKRLSDLAGSELEIIIFGDEVILNQPIEKWPRVECLIAFFSDGFPLEKAEAYVALAKPTFVVNDLGMQHFLLDRRLVYNRLLEHGIPVPRHIVVCRDKDVKPYAPTAYSEEEFEETEEYVRVGNTKIDKPFVEKPVSGEDHNVCIYYPHTGGGGMKRLFRKVGNAASEYCEPKEGEVYVRVRRDASYLYEDFMHTGGTDVKVYTVGPNYAHAEARKSPVVDGRVLRDENGKEIRYPVVLTPEEKDIARRVVLAFGQSVCGFDLLRCKGRSYVCDVNGWSFVKNSEKYYDDCAIVLRAMILQAVAPHHKSAGQAEAAAAAAQDEASNPAPTAVRRAKSVGGVEMMAMSEEDAPREELRCVLAVIRHGDRTPKQKMKMKVTDPRLLNLICKNNGGRPRKQAKMKRPAQLQELLDVARAMLSELLAQQTRNNARRSSERERAAHDAVRPDSRGEETCGDGTLALSEEQLMQDDLDDDVEKLRQVVAVLEEGGHFSGINRKAQLKPLAWAPIDPSSSTRGSGGALEHVSGTVSPPHVATAVSLDMADPLPKPDGAEHRLTFAQEPQQQERVTEALLILKFGGVLTHLGRKQAETLGRNFRENMYPPYDEDDGTGLLRLHSTYRHDLKIYSSDEGRVQMSAAAFAKGLLDLETPKGVSNEAAALTPILSALVLKDAKMLDFITQEVEDDIRDAKQKLYNIMTEGHGNHRGKDKLDTAISSASELDQEGGDADAHEGASHALAELHLDHASDGDEEEAAAAGLPGGRGPGQLPPVSEDSALPEQEMTPLTQPLSAEELLKAEYAVRHRPAGASVESAVFVRPPGVPKEPLKLLDRMLSLIKQLTTQLNSLCRKELRDVEQASGWAERLGALAPRGSQSNLSQSPVGASSLDAARSPLERRPAGGESFLLMHARWKKLEQDIYHEKKRRFDISKVPDVYDSAKYDAIHNEHLKLEGLDYLLPLAKVLADGVVPNEYGTHPHSRLRVGATIARDLIRKLLMDLGNTRNESFGLQQVPCQPTDATGSSSNILDPPPPPPPQTGQQQINVSTWQRQLMQNVQSRQVAADNETLLRQMESGGESQVTQSKIIRSPSRRQSRSAKAVQEDAAKAGAEAAQATAEDGSAMKAAIEEAVEDAGEDSEEDVQTTRLHSGFAPGVGVNTPNRHVRTRIYFTSESHIHSMMSVLRYCHLERSPLNGSGDDPAWWDMRHQSSNGSSSNLVAAAAAAAAAGPPPPQGSAEAVGEGVVPCAPAAALSGNLSGGRAVASSSLPEPLVTHQAESRLCATPEFDYLSQIVIRMYENVELPKEDPKRFRMEVAFSRGTATDVRLAPPLGPGGDVIHDAYLQTLTDRWPLTDVNTEQTPLTLQQLENYLWRFAKSTPGFQGVVGPPGELGVAFPMPPSALDLSSVSRASVPLTVDWGRTSASSAGGGGGGGGGAAGAGVVVLPGGGGGSQPTSAPPTPVKDPVTGAPPDPGVSIAVASPKHADNLLGGGGGLFHRQ